MTVGVTGSAGFCAGAEAGSGFGAGAGAGSGFGAGAAGFGGITGKLAVWMAPVGHSATHFLQSLHFV